MFRSVATKIAHNTTIPALAGNKDLRPLQDLITAEKAIVTSLVKLSTDFIKASDALRAWGQGEGEDLSDTLGCSTRVLQHFSSALSKFATHEQAIRDHLKAVRTREEKLDALKHRRKNVAASADSAEKKLNKMGPEHKNMQIQTDTLMRLQEEIRELDSEIMTEEAQLGDFKRAAAKMWMTLKFGGLQECCEKGLVVAEVGKLIVMEIPQEATEPGNARAYYTGHPRTESYVAEAQRSIDTVVFDGSLTSDRPRGVSVLHEHRPESEVSPTNPPGSMDYPQYPNPHYSTSPSSFGNTSSNLQVDEMGAITSQAEVPRAQTYAAPPSLPPPSPYTTETPSPNVAAMDGGATFAPGSRLGPGGQFATFPTKGSRQANSMAPSLSDPAQDPRNSSFSAEMDEAFSQGSRPMNGGYDGPAANGSEQAPRASFDEPAPTYESLDVSKVDYAPPQGPPPGAAPPAMPQETAYGGYNAGYEPHAAEEDEDVQLPYMEPARSERRVRFGSRPIEMTRPLSHLDREGWSPEESKGHEGALPTPTSPLPPHQETAESSHRMPTPPPPASQEDPDDERALNAAAAREVSRELDALSFSPPPQSIPPPPPREPSPLPSPLVIPSDPTPNPSRVNDAPQHVTSPFTRVRAREGGSPTSPSAIRSPEQTSPRLPSPVARIPSVPSSPTRSPLPPPPAISLPSAKSSPSPSFTGGTPYRTPPEYPLPGSSLASPAIPPSPSPSRGTVSPPLPPPGVRTISAAAFRRPVPRKTSDATLPPGPASALSPMQSPIADTTPLSVKKRGLPSSPYGSRLGGSFGSSPAQPPPAPPPQSRTPPPVSEDEQFDYISAYIGNNADEQDPARSTSNLR